MTFLPQKEWGEQSSLGHFSCIACRNLHCNWPDLEAVALGPSRRYAILCSPHCFGILDLQTITNSYQQSVMDALHSVGDPRLRACNLSYLKSEVCLLAAIPQPHRRITCASVLHEDYAVSACQKAVKRETVNPGALKTAEFSGAELVVAVGDRQSILTISRIRSPEISQVEAPVGTIFVGNSWDELALRPTTSLDSTAKASLSVRESRQFCCSALHWVMPTRADGSYVVCQRTCEALSAQLHSPITLWMSSVEQERSWPISLPLFPPPGVRCVDNIIKDLATSGESSRVKLFDLRATALGSIRVPGDTDLSNKYSSNNSKSTQLPTLNLTTEAVSMGAAYTHWATVHEAATLRPIVSFPFKNTVKDNSGKVTGIGWKTECFMRGELDMRTPHEHYFKDTTKHIYTLVLKNASSGPCTTADGGSCWWWACYDDRWPRSPVWWKRLESGYGHPLPSQMNVPSEKQVSRSEDVSWNNCDNVLESNRKDYTPVTGEALCRTQQRSSIGLIESLGRDGFAFAALPYQKGHCREKNQGENCLHSSFFSQLKLHTVQTLYGGRSWSYRCASTTTCHTPASPELEGDLLKSIFCFDRVLNFLFDSEKIGAV